jgi:NADH-quinone oxidoreductase subunit L
MPPGFELLLIPGLPLAAFLLISAFGLGKEEESAAPYVIVLALSGSLWLSLRALATVAGAGEQALSLPWLYVGPIGLNIGVLVDGLSGVMLVVVCAVSLLVQVYSIGYMRGEIGYGRYFAYMSLFSGSMLGLVISDNIVQTYIFWELVGICSYLLIGFWYRRPAAAAAAKKAFVVTRFGDLGFLTAVLLLSFHAQGAFGFRQLEALVTGGILSSGVVTAAALLVFCGAVGKSAQFPLHIWLPDAMEGPTPVSALIHAATMVAAGVYLVARAYFLFAAAPAALFVVALIGALTLFLAATMGVAENDIKRVLAYSTISQLGYMMLALGVGGYTAAVFHLTTHAFFKALLFLTAGSVIHAMHVNDMWQMGGLGRRMPITAVTCLVGALALAGIFPLSGFWSKDEILASAWASQMAGHQLFFALALATVFLTAFYMFRLWFVTFAGEPRTAEAAHAHESPLVMTVPLLVFAALAAVAGGLKTHVPWAGTGFGEVVHFPGTSEAASTLVMALSTAASLAGIALAWAAYRARLISSAAFNARLPALHRVLKNAWYFNRGWELFATRVVIAGSAVAAWFDRHVVNGMVDGVAWLSGWAGRRLRVAQTGQVQFYALIFLAGLLAGLVVIFGREQSLLPWLRHWP